MKLINSKIYLDYNATCPLANSVKEYFSRGDLLYANPSSVHSLGKKSKREINHVTDYLLQLFSLDDSFFPLYHSGATEGINTLIKGFAEFHYKKNQKIHFVSSLTDHSCVYNLKESLELYGHQVHHFSVNEAGDFDKDSLISLIQKLDGPVLLNYTMVNNETGVVWELEDALAIKKATGCCVHVDAVQSVGKIKDWSSLLKGLDAYTYSGHKFGALKGIGFSFIHEDFPFSALLRGGGQQRGLRSGTENVDGILSLRLALEELLSHFDFAALDSAKTDLENKLAVLIEGRGRIAAVNAKRRNSNTIYFTIKGTRADILMTAFDLAGLEVSSGSACSSGAVIASRVLVAMEFSEEEAKSAIRLSFSHYLTSKQAKTQWIRVETLLKRFLT